MGKLREIFFGFLKEFIIDSPSEKNYFVEFFGGNSQLRLEISIDVLSAYSNIDAKICNGKILAIVKDILDRLIQNIIFITLKSLF